MTFSTHLSTLAIVCCLASTAAAQSPPVGPPPPGGPPGALPPGAPPPGAPVGGFAVEGQMPSPKMLSALPISKDVAAPTDPKNLEGVYTAASMGLPSGFDNAPFTEKAAKEQAYARDMMAKGTPLGGLSATCRPNHPFGVGSDLFPGEITQNDKFVVLLNEEHRTRWIIYLDRVHPADLKPSYFGHSIGHWEGDTLVVETRGFNGKADLLSPEAVVVSRIRKIEGGSKIEIKSTTTDPVNYTQPVERTSVSSWNPGVQVLEFQCEENMEGAAEGLVMDPSKPTL